MRLSRRSILLGTAALALMPAAPLLRGGVQDYLYDLIAAQFGPAIADHSATAAFLDAARAALTQNATPWQRQVADAYFDYEIDRLNLNEDIEDQLDAWLIERFLQSTNAIDAVENKAALEFLGFFAPYENPCVNGLARRD